MLPFVLVVRGDDPEQAQFAIALYERVEKMLRDGTTAQALKVLDLAHPAISMAQNMSPFADIRVPPPFIVSLYPTRRVLRGEELNAFTRVIIKRTEPQPPAPPPVHHEPPAPAHSLPPIAPPRPDDGTVAPVDIAAMKITMAAADEPPERHAQPPQPQPQPPRIQPAAAAPPPELKMSNTAGGRPPARENSTPDPAGYQPSRQLKQAPQDEE